MSCNEKRAKNKSPPIKEKEFNLEDIINQKVSLDTDIMDFLLISGWSCFWGSPLYDNASEKVKNKLSRYIKQRRENIPHNEKYLESRFACNFAFRGYHQELFKNLKDVKNFIEDKGLCFRHIGYKSFAHFNETLKKYEVEPFKVGGRATVNILQRYGLEKAKKITSQ